MGLRITRSAGQVLYGGYDLDGDDLENTFDHRIWFRRFYSTNKTRSAVVNIETDSGVVEAVMREVGADSVLKLEHDVELTLVDIKEQYVDTELFCEVCGRGDPAPKRRVPQGRFNIEGPRSYQLIRDDARKK